MIATDDKNLLDAERLTIGSALLDPVAADTICAMLDAQDFAHPWHRNAYALLAAHVQSRTPFDAVTLAAASGGTVATSDLLKCQMAVTTTSHGKYHASLVLAASKLRQMARVLSEGLTATSEASLTRDAPEAILEPLRASLDQIAHRAPGRGPIKLADAEPDLVPRILRNEESPRGLPTGFPDLDRGLGGLRDGELVVMAARPGVGKSLFAANIAEHASTGESASKPVLFLSLEMSAESLYRRALFSRSGVRADLAWRGMLDGEEKALLQRANSELKFSAWYVHCEAPLTVQRAYAVARAFIAKHGRSLIVVDYLQLMTGPGQSRYEQVTNISAGLKQMAVELQCPVLALAQLNRQAGDPKEIPNLSDLRDSGAIEQDADVVMFISRDTNSQDPHVATITVAKNRNGRIGKADLLFDTNGPRFKSIAKVEEFR